MIPALRETTTDAIFFSLLGDGLGIRKNNLKKYIIKNEIIFA